MKLILLFFLCIFMICQSRQLLALTHDECSNSQYREVEGVSMSPLLKEGDIVAVLSNYYVCHEPKRGDIVTYHHAGHQFPLVKKIVALPGDKWSLPSISGEEFGIAVNGPMLKNDAGELYHISASKQRRLGLYLKSYSQLPPNTYMILGELPEGSLDSTDFGLVDKADILGRVERLTSKPKHITWPSADLKDRYIDATPSGWTCTAQSNTNYFGFATVSCSGSEIAVSGGCAATNGIGGSGPSGQGWFCADRVGGYGNSATAYANCCY